MKKRGRIQTFYPSKEELKHLADANDYVGLSKRLKDKTIENLVKDAIERRNKTKHHEALPRNVLMLIASFMNVKDVLELANKYIVFYLIVFENEDFWKRKFANEFPEVIYILGNSLDSDLTWRNYYNVTRYFIKKIQNVMLSKV